MKYTPLGTPTKIGIKTPRFKLHGKSTVVDIIVDNDHTALRGGVLVLRPICFAIVVYFRFIHECLESWDHQYCGTLVRSDNDADWLRYRLLFYVLATMG